MGNLGIDTFAYLQEFQRRNSYALQQDLAEALSSGSSLSEQVGAALAVFNRHQFEALAALVKANNECVEEDLRRLGILKSTFEL